MDGGTSRFLRAASPPSELALARKFPPYPLHWSASRTGGSAAGSTNVIKVDIA